MPQHPAIRTRRSRPAALALALVGVWLASPATEARADEFLDQANKAAAATPGTEPAEDILFPALVSMEAPPLISVGDLPRNEHLDVMRVGASDPQWGLLEQWAMGEPQRKALEALRTLADPEKTYILGIPYTAEGVDQAWVDAGLVNTMGESGLLLNVEFEYLDRLWHLSTLALVESKRLAIEGKGEESLQVLVDLIRLGRILTERAFTDEKLVGFGFMFAGAERMRDVVYTHTDAFESKVLSEAAEKIHPDALNIRRIPLAPGDRLRAEQLLSLAFEHRGAVKDGVLARIMANTEASERPLRLFSLQAWWRDLAKEHADWFDTGDRIGEVWKDYSKRWTLPFTNQLLTTPTHYSQIDPARYPLVFFAMRGIDRLFPTRFDIIVELAGTYNGLGVYAFKQRQRKFPPSLAAIHPGYVQENVKDITNLDTRYREPQAQDFGFKVPIRDDTFDRREDPHPFEVTVVLDPARETGVNISDIPEDVAWSDDLLMSWFRSVMLVSELPAGPFKRDMVDVEGQTINASALKDAVGTSVRQARFTRREIVGAQLAVFLLKQLSNRGMTGEVKRGIIETSEPLRQIRDELGVDIDPLVTLLHDEIMAVVGSEEFTALANKSMSRPFEEADARQWFRIINERVITDHFVEKATEVARAWGPRAVTAWVQNESGFADPHYASAKFIAPLDDSVFMLWAAGKNGVDNRAKVVGRIDVDAEDVLFWPPIIALEREFNR